MRTLPLAVLVALSVIAAWVSYARFDKLRGDAEGAAESLAVVKRDLTEIDRLRRGGARTTAAAVDAPELARELSAAATAAGLHAPPDSEPAAPQRVPGTDYTETPVYLRFDPLTLKQLVAFLHHLHSIDAASRSRRIELAPPQAGARATPTPPGAKPEDLWSADVEVSFVTHAPGR